MDLNQLVGAVQACLIPDANTRKAGEEALKQLPGTPGGLVNLLRVALEDSLDGTVRQIAAIAFKNSVKREWESKDKRPSPISESDKCTIRSLMMESIIRAPPTICVQVAESLKTIIYFDFPEQWPDLLPSVHAALASNDQTYISGALRVLRIIARKYEFKDEEDRDALNTVVQATFPSVLQVFQTLLANPSPSPDLAILLKLCCKIFWSSTYMGIPTILVTNDEQFTGWMASLLFLANRPVPSEGMPEDVQERKEWAWWKAKKWVFNVAYRLFTKLASTSSIRSMKIHGDTEAGAAFCARWTTEYSVPFLLAVLQEVSAVATEEYVAPRVANILLQYLTAAVTDSKTWGVLKDHIQSIVTNVVLPLLAFTDEDATLWEDDPQEYVRKGYDVIEDIYSSKNAALNLLVELCTSKKAKKTQLDPIMGHLVALLAQARQLEGCSVGRPPPDTASREASDARSFFRKLDGVLLAIGALDDVLKGTPRYRAQLEPMLQQHVAPLFASPHGHLRAKGCWLAGRYADIEFAAGKGKGPTFSSLFQAVIASLGDTELPVRVDAAVALRGFIDTVSDEDLSPLKHLVPELLQRFLSISQEVDSDELTDSLEVLVLRFGPEMAPYAVGVLTTLAHQFWRLMAEDDVAVSAAVGITVEDTLGDLDYDRSMLGGYSILSAMSSVLDAVSTLPHLYSQLEEVLFPILDRFTSQDGIDIFEEITGIITYLTYYGPSITPRMWSLYPRLLQCVDSWAVDYFADVLLPLDNYISRDTETFLSSTLSPSLLDLTNQTLEKLFTRGGGGGGGDEEVDELRDSIPEEAIHAGAKLISVILQNCRGRVDHCIGPYLALIISQLAANQDDKDMEDTLLVTGADALYYNAACALNSLSEASTLQMFMGSLGRAVSDKRKNGTMRHFPSKKNKKVVALGLASVLGVPSAALPSGVAGSLGQISLAALQVLMALKAQEEKDEAASKGGGSSSSSDGLGKFSGGPEEEEEEEEDLDEEALGRMARAAARRAGYADDDDEDWDSEDEWFSEDEDAEVSSPIDAVSPYIYFAEVLQGVQDSDPPRFAMIVNGMDAAAQSAVQGMLGYAAVLKNEQLALAAAAL